MKKMLSIIIVLLLICCSPIAVFAHRGRTDENGGHYVQETGEYHYHHGYPEHQHENGVCPYEDNILFDDDYNDTDDYNYDSHQTYHSGYKEYTYGEYVTKARNQKEKEQAKHDSKKTNAEIPTPLNLIIQFILTEGIFGTMFGSAFLIIFLVLFQFNVWEYKKYEHQYNDILGLKVLVVSGLLFTFAIIDIFFVHSNYHWLTLVSVFLEIIYFIYICRLISKKHHSIKHNEQIKKAEEQKEFENKKAHYTKLYGGKNICDLVDMPQTAYIDDKGKPHQIQYGEDIYTISLAHSYKKFHRLSCRYATNNIINYANLNYYSLHCSPCRVCYPVIPDTTWYKKYLEIKEIKEKYHID